MSPPAQDLSFSRLLLVVSGSVGAAYLPPWLVWLSRAHQDLETKTVLTRTAKRFVTELTVHASSGGEVVPDEWGEEVTEAVHVRWTEWADAVLVYPASMHYLGRMACGLADTPSLLTIHCSEAPVVVAPGLPPGAVHGDAYAEHVRTLESRKSVEIVPPVMGMSLTTGKKDVAASAWFPDAVARLEKLYRATHGMVPPEGEATAPGEGGGPSSPEKTG